MRKKQRKKDREIETWRIKTCKVDSMLFLPSLIFFNRLLNFWRGRETKRGKKQIKINHIQVKCMYTYIEKCE